ncbi:beta-lactamase [Emticicia oligotrophica DSM 17448]|uniref:Beta-lactamase n=1 Tax=Emticicia oligotrophica (strain DSM 17448 / CIP 109782 / MTCC 6937 / GPTSA100-15) TaxID=929562 RepID=A0ABM5N0V0_EMTOG|nr:serine hydrolase [Emticicia oligotrophica]AFK03028.1 beta-lactamase [Emticicia oligotrophica DSM 17448]
MKKIIFALIIASSSIFSSQAQAITSPEIDALVERTLKTFDVPGIAVAVIKDDKVIHAKGYGVRSLRTGQKVDENTLFGVASNSKAYTAAALGMLVDEKKISWDTKVTDIIPEFKLYNPYVTEEFTVRDLLCHRSGMGLGAGDLMMWPDSSNFTKADIIHNLRFLKPVSSFRTKYDYDNNLYIVAGEVVARVAGISWEEFVEKRIMQPLGMNKSAASLGRVKDKSNVIDPHAPVNGKVQAIGIDWSETANAAGGIYSSVADMSKWVIAQINGGKYGDGTKRLFSQDVHEEMWTPQTIIPVRGQNAYNTHFSAYGLGWFLSDVKGYKQATHTGGLAGIVTQVTILPELKLGIIVFTNQQVGAAFSAITNTIKDSYLGMPKVDRVAEYHARVVAANENAKKITDEIWKTIEAQPKSNAKVDPNLYVGTYRDAWFGDIIISLKNGKMFFDSKRSPRLSGEMLYYKGNTFVVKWNDRSLDADAYVKFSLDTEGKAAGAIMEAISPLTDFSFDFQDLEFKVVK